MQNIKADGAVAAAAWRSIVTPKDSAKLHVGGGGIISSLAASCS
jgi:hypothetical protein